MNAVVQNLAAPNHEVLRAFAAHSLPLCRALTEMLDEHVVHRSERRGCGFTQATRFIATPINLPNLPPMPGGGLFRPGVERRRGGRPGLLAHLRERGAQILGALTRSESRVFARMLVQVALREGSGIDVGAASVEKLPIGTCPLAEEYFLEIAYDSIRRGGTVNVIVAANGTPLLIEKCGLGDNHSSISVADIVLNGVALPPGSLLGVDRDATRDGDLPATRNGRGRIVQLRDVRRVRFLRLTTLAIAPADRARAFTTHFEQQVRGNLFSPDTTRIEQLIAFATVQTR